MEPQPGPSGTQTFLSPPKKRPRKSLGVEEKVMVMNAYKYAFKTWPVGESFSLGDCSKKAAEIVGVTAVTVERIVKENKITREFSKPKKDGPKTTFMDRMDDFDYGAIRRIVHQFFRRNELPTLQKILQAVNEDENLPNLSRSKLQKVMKKLNFKFVTRQRQSLLLERQDLILWRQRYLKAINNYRRENKFIYYQDETFLNEGHTVKKTWVDKDIKSSKQAFLEGLTTGMKAPSGKGKRLIICHIGSEEGFVNDGLLLFQSKQGSGDYHQEMNSRCFEEWFEGILPKLKKDSVLVIDNAPYHSRKVEKIPTSSWTKVNIQNWLTEKNIDYDHSSIKATLLKIVKENKSRYDKYVIDEMAAQHGVTVLRLPPYHCELNPIELIWAQVKGYVARHNKTFKIKDIIELFEKGLREVTPENWAQCISHVRAVEKQMYDVDNMIDTVADRFIMENVNESDSDSVSNLSDISG